MKIKCNTEIGVVPPEKAILEIPINNEELLLDCMLDNFDRDGYEFLPIEQEYYRSNGITLYTKEVLAKESGCGNEWSSLIFDWAYLTEESENIFLDHSYVLQSYKFVGRAKEQILRMAKYRKELIKLSSSKIKYGFDFCLDYIHGDVITEIIHFEWDYHEEEYDYFIRDLKTVSDKIERIDWKQHCESITQFYANPFSNNLKDDYKLIKMGIGEAYRYRRRF